LFMEQKIKFLIITVAAIVIILTGLFAASISQIFPFSSDVRVNELENNDGKISWSVYDGEIFLGEIYFRIDPSYSTASHQMAIHFSLFYNETELDSVKIRFSGGTSVISVYREATSYTWEHRFQREGGDTVLDVPDLGWFGQSTTSMNFILFPIEANSLYLTMDLSMHRTTPLQLTSLKAHVYIDVPIPKGAI
jgi:hypothetical protein